MARATKKFIQEHNARMKRQAAATDLLEACKAALKRWGMHSCGEVKMLADAIAKAEGEDYSCEDGSSE